MRWTLQEESWQRMLHSTLVVPMLQLLIVEPLSSEHFSAKYEVSINLFKRPRNGRSGMGIPLSDE